MHQEFTIDLGGLLLSLSDAMNLAVPDLASHGIRTGFIAWRTGWALGLDEANLGRLVAAALLHDMGAVSTREQKSLLVGGDIEPDTQHCVRGAMLLEQASLLRHLAPVVRHHHRPAEQWGSIDQGQMDRLLSQIVLLGDRTDRALRRGEHVLLQSKEVRETVRRLAPRQVSADVVDAFMQVSEPESFWLELGSKRLFGALLLEGPIHSQRADLPSLLEISVVFRSIVDYRSRFTATHSAGVARSAVLLATIHGMSEPDLRLMQVAGDMHDLGKLAIPNEILDKPAGLDAREFQIMKQHTFHTYTILDQISGLRQIPQWAAFHHERLDGNGYPFRLGRDGLDTGARIMAVADTFTALAEDRPYRQAMDSAEIRDVLNRMAEDGRLDLRLVRTMVENMGSIRPLVGAAQEEARDFYEDRFARSAV